MILTVTVPFYKVVVLSVGLIETVIVDERHFTDRDGANAYMQTLAKGLIGVLVEV